MAEALKTLSCENSVHLTVTVYDLARAGSTFKGFNNTRITANMTHSVSASDYE